NNWQKKDNSKETFLHNPHKAFSAKPTIRPLRRVREGAAQGEDDRPNEWKYTKMPLWPKHPTFEGTEVVAVEDDNHDVDDRKTEIRLIVDDRPGLMDPAKDDYHRQQSYCIFLDMRTRKKYEDETYIQEEAARKRSRSTIQVQAEWDDKIAMYKEAIQRALPHDVMSDERRITKRCTNYLNIVAVYPTDERQEYQTALWELFNEDMHCGSTYIQDARAGFCVEGSLLYPNITQNHKKHPSLKLSRHIEDAAEEISCTADSLAWDANTQQRRRYGAEENTYDDMTAIQEGSTIATFSFNWEFDIDKPMDFPGVIQKHSIIIAFYNMSTLSSVPIMSREYGVEARAATKEQADQQAREGKERLVQVGFRWFVPEIPSAKEDGKQKLCAPQGMVFPYMKQSGAHMTLARQLALMFGDTLCTMPGPALPRQVASNKKIAHMTDGRGFSIHKTIYDSEGCSTLELAGHGYVVCIYKYREEYRRDQYDNDMRTMAVHAQRECKQGDTVDWETYRGEFLKLFHQYERQNYRINEVNLPVAEVEEEEEEEEEEVWWRRMVSEGRWNPKIERTDGHCAICMLPCGGTDHTSGCPHIVGEDGTPITDLGRMIVLHLMNVGPMPEKINYVIWADLADFGIVPLSYSRAFAIDDEITGLSKEQYDAMKSMTMLTTQEVNAFRRERSEYLGDAINAWIAKHNSQRHIPTTFFNLVQNRPTRGGPNDEARAEWYKECHAMMSKLFHEAVCLYYPHTMRDTQKKEHTTPPPYPPTVPSTDPQTKPAQQPPVMKAKLPQEAQTMRLAPKNVPNVPMVDKKDDRAGVDGKPWIPPVESPSGSKKGSDHGSAKGSEHGSSKGDDESKGSGKEKGQHKGAGQAKDHKGKGNDWAPTVNRGEPPLVAPTERPSTPPPSFPAKSDKTKIADCTEMQHQLFRDFQRSQAAIDPDDRMHIPRELYDTEYFDKIQAMYTNVQQDKVVNDIQSLWLTGGVALTKESMENNWHVNMIDMTGQGPATTCPGHGCSEGAHLRGTFYRQNTCTCCREWMTCGEEKCLECHLQKENEKFADEQQSLKVASQMLKAKAATMRESFDPSQVPRGSRSTSDDGVPAARMSIGTRHGPTAWQKDGDGWTHAPDAASPTSQTPPAPPPTTRDDDAYSVSTASSRTGENKEGINECCKIYEIFRNLMIFAGILLNFKIFTYLLCIGRRSLPPLRTHQRCYGFLAFENLPQGRCCRYAHIGSDWCCSECPQSGGVRHTEFCDRAHPWEPPPGSHLIFMMEEVTGTVQATDPNIQVPEQVANALARGYGGAQEIPSGAQVANATTQNLWTLLGTEVVKRPSVPQHIRTHLLPECAIWDPGATADMGSIYAIAMVDETLDKMSGGRLKGKWSVPTAARTFRVANGQVIPASFEVEFRIPLAKLPKPRKYMTFRVAAIDTGKTGDVQVPWLFSNASGRKIGAMASSRTGKILCEDEDLEGLQIQMTRSKTGHWLFPIVNGFIGLATPWGASKPESCFTNESVAQISTDRANTSRDTGIVRSEQNDQIGCRVL
ncbi:MAG: hypothetical protein CBC48_01070, partial [bacterium TMED88]